MSDSDSMYAGPVMDGATEATEKEKLDGLKAQVEHDHADETDAAKQQHLGERVDEHDRLADHPGD
jgi:hypothetical protein